MPSPRDGRFGPRTRRAAANSDAFSSSPTTKRAAEAATRPLSLRTLSLRRAFPGPAVLRQVPRRGAQGEARYARLLRGAAALRRHLGSHVAPLMVAFSKCTSPPSGGMLPQADATAATISMQTAPAKPRSRVSGLRADICAGALLVHAREHDLAAAQALEVVVVAEVEAPHFLSRGTRR